MTITPLRAVPLAGLLLVAVCVLASAAAAKGPEQAYRASPPAAVETSSSSVPDGQCPCNAGLPDGPSGALSARFTPESIAPAGTVGISTVSDARCPCNAGLPVGQAAGVSSQQCPCNVAGGPPGGLPTLLRTIGSRAAHSGGVIRVIRGYKSGVVHPSANQLSRTFDWSDASVGAAVTAGIGLLILAGASLFGRRRVSERLPAS
jgi:hypothetical protein